jgi:transposase
MLSLTSTHRYYLYFMPVDMRKSFDSLCGIVQGNMCRDAMSGEVFIFINRPRNKIKLLHWEPGGFVLYYKRLESGTFELPVNGKPASVLEIDWYRLMMMIEGISMKNIHKRKRYCKPVKT